MDWFGVLNITQSQPCQGQGHLPAAQAAPNPVKPGLGLSARFPGSGSRWETASANSRWHHNGPRGTHLAWPDPRPLQPLRTPGTQPKHHRHCQRAGSAAEPGAVTSPGSRNRPDRRSMRGVCGTASLISVIAAGGAAEPAERRPPPSSPEWMPSSPRRRSPSLRSRLRGGKPCRRRWAGAGTPVSAASAACMSRRRECGDSPGSACEPLRALQRSRSILGAAAAPAAAASASGPRPLPALARTPGGPPPPPPPRAGGQSERCPAEGVNLHSAWLICIEPGTAPVSLVGYAGGLICIKEVTPPRLVCMQPDTACHLICIT